MKTSMMWGVSGRRSLFIWGLFCVTAGIVFLTYTLTSLAAGRGEFVMPLDDVYIHFQYARQLASGQPYVYNPGLPASSGATSFLYPYILALGYLIGFHGLQLGLWAMIVGALTLVGSLWLIYRIVQFYGAPEWLAGATALIFGITGSVSWHYMSGMETGLMILFTLGVVDAVGRVIHIINSASIEASYTAEKPEKNELRSLILWATLAAMIRPEGGLLAVLAVGTVGWSLFKQRKHTRAPFQKWVWLLLVPVLSIGVQPLVNLTLTGSVVASGNAAKSIFGTIPFYWNEVIRRVLENWGRIWLEFGTGISPREGMYVPPFLLLLAIVGMVWLVKRRETRWTGLMILAWLAGGTLMIATLDTAFWHFKRYQMPFMALLFPLSALSFQLISFRPGKAALWLRAGVVSVMVVLGVWTAGQFLQHYALNVNYVYLQPLQMARWLQANTPESAVIAVHDTGMMHYMGGRPTLDMVGLTTAGAADYWRNGPGSVAEYLIDKHPDYVAAYGPGHGLGLGMIADTPVYGNLLAGFPVTLDQNYNVALAADFQGIYKPELNRTRPADSPFENQSIFYYYLAPYWSQSLGVVDALNVADITSEQTHQYRWSDTQGSEGFPTEVHAMAYAFCLLSIGDECNIVDGGRLINREETFTLKTEAGHDAMLITRLHPANNGTMDVYVDSILVATRWIPYLPGQWLDVATLIPADFITDEDIEIRIVPHVENGFYMPYFHWLMEGTYTPEKPTGEPVATFEGGAITVGVDYSPTQSAINDFSLRLNWYTDGKAKGDYKVFVHLYQDVNQPPVAQVDQYPGSGTLLPGNWLPGMLWDTITVDLGEVPPGKYQVAIGLYNPYTNERLQPTGGDDQGRLFIGEVDIQ